MKKDKHSSGKPPYVQVPLFSNPAYAPVPPYREPPVYEMPRRCFQLAQTPLQNSIIRFMANHNLYMDGEAYYDRFAGRWAIKKLSLRLKDLFWWFVDWMFL